MGDPGSSDSWKKLVIAKANDQWVSISSIKKEHTDDVGSTVNTGNFSLDYEQTPYHSVKEETTQVSGGHDWHANEASSPESENDTFLIQKKMKGESSEERSSRLAKMSAYAAQRLANETPEQRAIRLSRMSQYAAKRLASETSEQRARRLARMSAYAAKRLARETPEQRQARLTRMSAYAAKRHAMKKMSVAAAKNPQSNENYCGMTTITLHRPNQS